MLDVVESEVLGDGRKFVSDKALGVTDLHAMWMIEWELQMMEVDKEPGSRKDHWPKVHR